MRGMKKNYKILRSLKLDVEVLWRREEKDRGVSASWVRSCIAMDEEWAHLVHEMCFRQILIHALRDKMRPFFIHGNTASHPWAHLVPKSVYKYLTETHLVDRIKHLEKIRIEEKMVL